MKAALIIDAKTKLGEGAFWDVRARVLYWVDIEGRQLRVYDPRTQRERVHATSDRVGTVVPRASGGVVMAVGRGAVIVDEPGGAEQALCTFDEEPADSRMNDGKCDPAGRLWVGSISTKGVKEGSALYRVEPDGAYRQMLTGVTVSNGIVWTADERTMYYIDTPTRNVQGFDYDRASGDITNARVAFNIPDGMGFPDGMTIDSEGMLWIAMWGGSAVRRFDPDSGRMLSSIDLPASNVTSCALGGDDLRDLYITTASVGLNEDQRAAQPTAGGLFHARVDVPGVPQHRFAG
ncbi:MAG: SMP-30/gluconolactonase/LRE family protein [Spirochaetaceae bacterium]|nr:MAG: SMP-30/gluconolactonase/LRE family protein [Spirochaetaceae bacterium]